MRKIAGIAALGIVVAIAGCSQGTPDPEPRPQTLEEYQAALDAADGARDVRTVPMLLKEQKQRALKQMGGRASADDFPIAPNDDPVKAAAWRETGIAYFNAPFGTVEERRAWEAYMTVIHSESGPDSGKPAEG